MEWDLTHLWKNEETEVYGWGGICLLCRRPPSRSGPPASSRLGRREVSGQGLGAFPTWPLYHCRRIPHSPAKWPERKSASPRGSSAALLDMPLRKGHLLAVLTPIKIVTRPRNSLKVRCLAPSSQAYWKQTDRNTNSNIFISCAGNDKTPPPMLCGMLEDVISLLWASGALIYGEFTLRLECERTIFDAWLFLRLLV